MPNICEIIVSGCGEPLDKLNQQNVQGTHKSLVLPPQTQVLFSTAIDSLVEYFFHIRWILCQKWYRRKSNNKIKEKSWTVSLNSQDWSMIVERVNCLALVLDFLSNWSKGNAWIPKPQWFYRLLYSLNWTNREKFAQFFFLPFLSLSRFDEVSATIDTNTLWIAQWENKKYTLRLS